MSPTSAATRSAASQPPGDPSQLVISHGITPAIVPGAAAKKTKVPSAGCRTRDTVATSNACPESAMCRLAVERGTKLPENG
jgi:hypothetical protein